MSDAQGPCAATVNGRAVERAVEPRLLLSDFLRHDLGLTGTHVGCEHGVCGACTVLFDGEPVRSCLMLAVQADGHGVETVESLAPGAAGDPAPSAAAGLPESHGLQCGFCTPGYPDDHGALSSRENPDARPRTRSAGPLRQSLPLHRLPAHRRRRAARGARRAGGARPPG